MSVCSGVSKSGIQSQPMSLRTPGHSLPCFQIFEKICIYDKVLENTPTIATCGALMRSDDNNGNEVEILGPRERLGHWILLVCARNVHTRHFRASRGASCSLRNPQSGAHYLIEAYTHRDIEHKCIADCRSRNSCHGGARSHRCSFPSSTAVL
jgi:hypothetical protein